MAAKEATAPANTFKSRVLTQGSHLLKAAEPSSFLSGAAVSSDLYPWMTGNQKQLMRAYAATLAESPAPCDQKQLIGSLDSAVSTAPGKDEKIIKENNLKLAKKCQDISGNEIVGDCRLRNAGDVASPSGSTGIKDSLVETACANQHFSAKFYKRKDNSAKRQRLEPTLLHGAVAQSGEPLHDHVLNTHMTLQDSETNMVETENHGTKSTLTKEELEEKEEKIKKSKRESALRPKLRKQEELETLREKAEKLKRENSKLKKKIMQISEECQEVNEENHSLMDEVEETHGPDAISDIRSRNPASVNKESKSNEERTSSDNNSTDNRNRDMSP